MIASLFASFTVTRIGKLLPPWMWIALAGAVIALGGVLWHHHVASDAIAAAKAEQKAADDKATGKMIAGLNQQALAIRQQADRTGAAISNLVRTDHEKQNAAIAGTAGSQLVLGPGKARCGPVGNPGVSASASGHIETAASTDAAGPDVPQPDGTDVPWGWLVQRAEEHDQLLSETQAWRDWYAKEAAAWAKMRESAAKSPAQASQDAR